MAKKITASSARLGAPILKLVPAIPIRRLAPGVAGINQDCVNELRKLLREAECGLLTGIVFASMTYDDRDGHIYRVGAVGQGLENPTFSLGMVEMLKDYLMEHALEAQKQ